MTKVRSICAGEASFTKLPGLSKPLLHTAIAEALGSRVCDAKALEAVPFILSHEGLGDLAFYAFTLTSPPGGRPTGEYKIQVILPGQARGARGMLRYKSGSYTLLIGWSADESTFALWDAYAHPSFAYSQNMQVKGSSIWLARTRGITSVDRRLRHEGIETVVLSTAEHLEVAIRTRMRLSAARLAETIDSA